MKEIALAVDDDRDCLGLSGAEDIEAADVTTDLPYSLPFAADFQQPAVPGIKTDKLAINRSAGSVLGGAWIDLPEHHQDGGFGGLVNGQPPALDGGRGLPELFTTVGIDRVDLAVNQLRLHSCRGNRDTTAVGRVVGDNPVAVPGLADMDARQTRIRFALAGPVNLAAAKVDSLERSIRLQQDEFFPLHDLSPGADRNRELPVDLPADLVAHEQMKVLAIEPVADHVGAKMMPAGLVFRSWAGTDQAAVNGAVDHHLAA